jgi:hypothetical protein
MRPDKFFDDGPRQRLEELMALRREAMAGRAVITVEEEAELEQLVDGELKAATERAAALFHDLSQ